MGLTREIIMAATGLHLRELVAEHVMGWKQINALSWGGTPFIPVTEKRGEFSYQPVNTHPWRSERGEVYVLDDKWTPRTPHHYFLPDQYIGHAWQVVDYLLSRTPQQDFHLEHLDGEWGVSTCYEDEAWSDWVRAETAPLAICRAALLAVMGKEVG